MELFANWHLVELWQQTVSTLTAPAFSLATFTSYALIVAAEMGDKSQLVCMSLAARHKGMPVFWGALAAYALLNALAVIFGSVIASWLPDYVVAFVVSLLFAVFGVQAWFTEEDDDDEEVVEKKWRQCVCDSVFINYDG
ncbi:TMEM165/GDT1 family protein [Methylocucumis oryzae]|uniref:TMEM165/GDT1 family protein n=1 Tax=Methylocucumis oryzae TaxID=1632867 RepID=UPI00308446F9